jgi:hypothetical protein
MGTAFAITRLDLTASELREAATEAKDVAAARRMLCLAVVLDGADRTSVAETWGMDRQTLRDGHVMPATENLQKRRMVRQRWDPTPVFGLSVSSRLSGIWRESFRSG